MRAVILITLLGIGLVVGKHCTSNSDCTHHCDGGYHGHCTITAGVGKCECPNHSCRDKADCPTGHMSGCPPDHAHCVDGKCSCTM